MATTTAWGTTVEAVQPGTTLSLIRCNDGLRVYVHHLDPKGWRVSTAAVGGAHRERFPDSVEAVVRVLHQLSARSELKRRDDLEPKARVFGNRGVA